VEAPLRGIRVLVTRAAESGGELARELERRGATVRNVPLIRIGPPPSERELQAAVDAADDCDWIVFASVNGVRSFCARRSTPLPPRVRVAAIGSTTAQAAREELDISDVVAPAHFVAEELADEVLHQAAPGSSVLVIQAADARPALAARLRAGRMRVTTIAAYSTVAIAPEDLSLRVKDCDVVTLASASAVRSLVAGLGGKTHAPLHLRGKLVTCIGGVTELEAREHGVHVELVPPHATVESLVDALCAYYSASQSEA